jgi:DNA-binding response OmpR family regulator
MYKILVADNQPEWRSFSKRVLEAHGYEVHVVETINKLDQALGRDRYDLILLNAELLRDPSLDAVRSLFQRYTDKPIIVVSVPSVMYHAVQETRTAFRLGAKDCVDKPFSAGRLLDLVHQLLNEFANHHAQNQGACL